MKMGQGLENKLDMLSKLTDKICKGSKCKKVKDQIIVLLDILFKEGVMNSQDVEQYYKQFIFP